MLQSRKIKKNATLSGSGPHLPDHRAPVICTGYTPSYQHWGLVICPKLSGAAVLSHETQYLFPHHFIRERNVSTFVPYVMKSKNAHV